MGNKINFTKEHQVRLFNAANLAVFNNKFFNTPMGGTATIQELLHQTTVNTLIQMKQALDKKISSKEAADEWSMTDEEQRVIANLKADSELINLVIGWKKYTNYQNEIAKKKVELNKMIDELKESQKTPEDKIKELESELKSLDE